MESHLVASMCLEQKLCYYLSPLMLFVVCVVCPIILTFFGLCLFRRIVASSFLKQNHDVTGPFFSTLGTVYGIFLAFVVSTMWQQFSTTSTNLVQEARYLGDLYFATKAFAQPEQGELQQLLRNYRDSVVNEEWKSMEQGEANPKSRQLLEQIGSVYMHYKPNNESENEFLHVSIQYVTSMTGLRTSRIDDSSSGLIPLLWVVLLIGAAATIFCSFLFEARNFRIQAVMTILLTGVICMTFYTIIDLDFPFTGGTTVSPEPLQSLKMQ